MTTQHRLLILAGATALILATLIPLIPIDEPFAGWDLWNMGANLTLAWLLLSLATAGVVLIWNAFVWDRREKIMPRPRQLLPDVVLRSLAPFPKHRQVPLIMGMPHFGLYWGLIPFLLVLFFSFSPSRQMGLRVRLPSRYVAALPRAPQSESLGVYVDTGGRFYVNGQVVSRDQLRARLQAELGRRSLWIVSIEANDDIAFAQAVYAIDIIRGLGAQVYWITPRVRAELEKMGDR
jgi:biopolymer transport protein ExbD